MTGRTVANVNDSLHLRRQYQNFPDHTTADSVIHISLPRLLGNFHRQLIGLRQDHAKPEAIDKHQKTTIDVKVFRG